MVSFHRKNFALCGKTIQSIGRNLLEELLPLLDDMGFRCEKRTSKNLLTVRLGGRVNTFYLFGGRDEGSAALIQGITLAGALLDEVALMPRSFVEQAVVLLQPGVSSPLVLSGVGTKGGGEESPAPPFFYGGQSWADP